MGARGAWRATRDLRRAVVVDKTLPTVRQQRGCDDLQLFSREGCPWCVRCGRLAGPQQGTWGSRRTGAATGLMVTAATVDASAVRSAGRYCLSPVVARARWLQAAVQAATLQFVRCGSAKSALLLTLCCTVVVVSSRRPCSSSKKKCFSNVLVYTLVV